jgi:ABC-type amino acid transport substrate-binding protein
MPTPPSQPAPAAASPPAPPEGPVAEEPAIPALDGPGPDVPKGGLFSDYRKIPGITQEEIEAVERLKRERSFLVYGSCLSSEAFPLPGGGVGGFSAHMAGWLTRLFGIEFQPRIYSWDALMRGMESGEVDFTGELSPTEARRDDYFLSPPVAVRGTKYFRIRGAEPLESLAKSRRLRLAFLRGSVTEASVARSCPFPFDPVDADGYADAYRLVSGGAADAFVGESPAEAAFDEYGDVEASDFLPFIPSPVSISTRSASAAAIVGAVDKAVRAGAGRELMEMYNRGWEDYRRRKYARLLTPEELRFLERRIASGNPILYAAEDDNYPVSFFNTQEGEFQGIAPDVLKAVGRLTGLAFLPANEGPMDWAGLLSMLEEGQASLVTELVRTPAREGRFLWADPPYSREKYALISLTRIPDRSLGEILFSDVGVVTDTAWAQAFRSWFPGHPSVREYPTSDEGIDALERGEIELLMGSLGLNFGLATYRERPGFKVNHVFASQYDCRFGFNPHETMVRSLVSKALPLVDTQSIADRWNQRTFDYRGRRARSLLPWLAVSAGVLALLLALAAVVLKRRLDESMRLETEIRDRTVELAEQKEEAYRQLRAKGDFLARMSHEIRTPMNAVIGMA